MISHALKESDRKGFYEFWAYWEALPKDGLVPHLEDYFSNAPTSLQPGMLILDILSPEDVSVRLAGTAVVEAVGELTGTDAAAVYSPEARKIMIGRSWTAVNHPCGYIHTRVYRNVDGLKLVSPGMGLPIRTSNPDLKTVMVFNDEARIGDPIGLADDDGVVQTHGKVQWLDIGAGTPD